MKRSFIYSITVLLAAGLVSSCTKTESTATTAPEKAPAKYEKPSKKYEKAPEKYDKPTLMPKSYDKPTPMPKKSYDEPTPMPKSYDEPTPKSYDKPTPKSTAAAAETSAPEETLSPANIAFNTPKWMAYGETKSIHLVLDLTKSTTELEKMVEGEGPRETAAIRTSHLVKANLVGGGFEITPISPETQPVFRKEVTEWKWDIRAKRFSSQRLHLSLTALVKVDGAERTRGIRTFDRDIVVRVMDLQSGMSAVQDNWPFVTGAGTLVLGFFGWLVRRLFTRRPATTTS